MTLTNSILKYSKLQEIVTFPNNRTELAPSLFTRRVLCTGCLVTSQVLGRQAHHRSQVTGHRGATVVVSQQ